MLIKISLANEINYTKCKICCFYCFKFLNDASQCYGKIVGNVYFVFLLVKKITFSCLLRSRMNRVNCNRSYLHNKTTKKVSVKAEKLIRSDKLVKSKTVNVGFVTTWKIPFAKPFLKINTIVETTIIQQVGREKERERHTETEKSFYKMQSKINKYVQLIVCSNRKPTILLQTTYCNCN